MHDVREALEDHMKVDSSAASDANSLQVAIAEDAEECQGRARKVKRKRLIAVAYS